MKSLAGRLIAVVLATSLVVVLATALLTQRITADELEEAFIENEEQREFVSDQLESYLFLRGNWEGVEGVIAELAEILEDRVVLTDIDLTIIADSDPSNPPLPDRETAFIDPTNPAGDFSLPIEGVIFGELDFELYADCLDSFGIPYQWFDEFGPEVIEDLTNEEWGRVDDCQRDLLQSEVVLDDDGADSNGADSNGADGDDERLQALVFIGTEGDSTLAGLDQGVDPMLWWVMLGAFTLAGLVTWFAVRRELEPVSQLVSAAGQIGSGDLSARVAESGSEELKGLATSFNQMASSIETEDQRRRGFTSDVAHELRTPLANMRGYLESAQDGISKVDDQLIDSLHDDALHMQAIVDDLQVLTLAEAGTLRVEPRAIPVEQLMWSVVTAHKQTADAKSVDLTAHETDLEVLADPDRLRQVLSNLVSNAIRHTSSGGSVMLATRTHEGQAVISVTDTGEGIEPEHLPRLFDRFYRVDSSRSKATGGSGLGLAIAKQLVDAHRGTLSVTSTVGQGTTFEVYLPVPNPNTD